MRDDMSGERRGMCRGRNEENIRYDYDEENTEMADVALKESKKVFGGEVMTKKKRKRRDLYAGRMRMVVVVVSADLAGLGQDALFW